jgi:hypothetical protein
MDIIEPSMMYLERCAVPYEDRLPLLSELLHLSEHINQKEKSANT